MRNKPKLFDSEDFTHTLLYFVFSLYIIASLFLVFGGLVEVKYIRFFDLAIFGVVLGPRQSFEDLYYYEYAGSLASILNNPFTILILLAINTVILSYISISSLSFLRAIAFTLIYIFTYAMIAYHYKAFKYRSLSKEGYSDNEIMEISDHQRTRKETALLYLFTVVLAVIIIFAYRYLLKLLVNNNVINSIYLKDSMDGKSALIVCAISSLIIAIFAIIKNIIFSKDGKAKKAN